MIMIFTLGEEGSGVTLRQLTVFQTLGALLFTFGVFLEIPRSKGWRAFFITLITIACAVMWIVFFSRLLVPQTGHVMGIAGYGLMIMFYLQLKH